MLLTSHYLAEVEQLCGHVYVIDRGGLVAEGSPAALTAGTRLPYAVELTLAVAAPTRPTRPSTRSPRGPAPRYATTPTTRAGRRVTVRHPDDLAGELTTAVVRAGGAIVRLEVTPPTLEDAILSMAAARP